MCVGENLQKVFFGSKGKPSAAKILLRLCECERWSTKTLYKARACSVGFIYLGMPIWHFKFLRFY
jgi:hypothetical protein